MRMGSLFVEPEAVSDRGRLAATGDPQLGQDPRDVHAGGLGGDEQCLADLPVGSPSATSASTSASRCARPSEAAGEDAAGADPRARRRARRPPAAPEVDALAGRRGNGDWYYGVHRGCLEELVDYWRSGYDWRAAEAAINAYEHYRVQVEGVPVHFMRRLGVGRTRSH
jgi:hypothetical protein